ncbi:MAG: monofunctional biosynthetic peptidoglycan transglycosylase [Chitinophagaceae bacterium]
MKLKGIVPRIWRKIKRIFLILFLAQLAYIVLLKWVNPPFTPTMVWTWVSLIGSRVKFHKTWINYDQISPFAKLAVMAGEDQEFPEDDGFDFKAIEQAFRHNEKSKHIRGGSTISQQVAKNVFLWQGKSYFRKALEAYFTFMIEKIWGKKRILEMYLNVAQTGPGIFGMEAAAQYYYGKSARTLDREEAAMIAAALPNPVRFKIKPPSRFTSWRQGILLVQMHNISDDPKVEALIREK